MGSCVLRGRLLSPSSSEGMTSSNCIGCKQNGKFAESLSLSVTGQHTHATYIGCAARLKIKRLEERGGEDGGRISCFAAELI